MNRLEKFGISGLGNSYGERGNCSLLRMHEVPCWWELKSFQIHGGTLLLNEGGLSSSPVSIVRDCPFYPGTFLVIASNFVGLYNLCTAAVIYIEPCIQQMKIMHTYA